MSDDTVEKTIETTLEEKEHHHSCGCGCEEKEDHHSCGCGCEEKEDHHSCGCGCEEPAHSCGCGCEEPRHSCGCGCEGHSHEHIAPTPCVFPYSSEEGWVDITDGQGLVFKKILTEGDGDECTPEADCTCHYTGTLENGTKFDSSVDRGTPFTCKCGPETNVIKAWDVTLRSMREGEKCKIWSHYSYAYGVKGSPPSIPPCSPLVFEMELLEFTEIDHEYFYDNKEKYEGAFKRKIAGNELVKQKKWKKAATKYEKGTQLIERLYDCEDELKLKSDLLRQVLFTNWAFCLIKLNSYVKAIDTANEGRMIFHQLPEEQKKDPVNIKIEIKACAHQVNGFIGLGDFEKAWILAKDYAERFESQPLKKLADKAFKLKKESAEKKKSLYKKMLFKPKK
ncbi:FKBP-type peptidyl-prolyl cis-trans isomerase [Aduncisulcus paluster]|uniref:peptidylprolyl isomerase n=1 Tax=Aduncisulcus paluster TaxID=2918883 RepID=A0ABQ5K0X1_9EUKA|nr:FKBP-type peptidyl-prolyl cis-trans isomerase [Aduncisulcus paluster]